MKITKDMIGEEIEIEGTVGKVTKPYLVVINAKFECPSCGTIIEIIQGDANGKIREPKNCACGRKGSFNLIEKEIREEQEFVFYHEESEFDFRAYLTSLKLIEKFRETQKDFIRIKAQLRDEFRERSNKGEFVLIVSNVSHINKKEVKKGRLDGLLKNI